MFEGFKHTAITVPSCSEHNSEKSNMDRAVVTGLVRTLDQMPVTGSAPRPFPANVSQAIARLAPNYAQANNMVTMQPYLLDGPDELMVDLPFLEPDAQLIPWIKQLTAALVWSAIGYYDPETDWDAALAWSRTYVRVIGPITASEARHRALDALGRELKLENECSWSKGWSGKPDPYPADIFRFDVSFLPQSEGENHIIFRHTFYDDIKWFVGFTTSPRTVQGLRKAVGASRHSIGRQDNLGT